MYVGFTSSKNNNMCHANAVNPAQHFGGGRGRLISQFGDIYVQADTRPGPPPPPSLLGVFLLRLREILVTFVTFN